MPDQVGGEHTDEHVCLDSGFEVVMDRAQVNIDGFQGPEVALDPGQSPAWLSVRAGDDATAPDQNPVPTVGTSPRVNPCERVATGSPSPTLTWPVAQMACSWHHATAGSSPPPDTCSSL